MDRWIVLWVKGERIGSFLLTEQNLATMKAEFHVSLIQRDDSGTEHWDVMAPRRRRRVKPRSAETKQ